MREKQKNEGVIKPQPDEDIMKSVREIILLFVKTLAQVKLFSLLHVNTKKFMDQLFGKMYSFLEGNGRLDLDIGEFAFLYEGEAVYEDKQISKSLPFLFHKDGVKTLTFLRGLGRGEIEGLLQIIKEVSQLPPEEGDIVVLLWEKDFSDIQYYAPDEFLETKIGAGMEAPVEYRLDPSSLETGHIKLSQEDGAALSESEPPIFKLEDMSRNTEEPAHLKRESRFPWRLPSLSSEELEALEKKIQTERSRPSEEEFLSLLVEMSYLEERGDEFISIMEVLVEHHREGIKNGEFLKGASLLGHIIDLQEELSSRSKERAAGIDRFLKEIRSGSTLSLIEKVFDDSRVDDLGAFFKYIYLFGPYSLKLVGDLYERNDDPGFRQQVLSYMGYFIGEDLPDVMKVLGESRPEFTKGTLSVLGEIGGERMTEHLAVFVDCKDSDLRRKAVRTVARLKGPSALRILSRFLEDEESDIRTEAALSLQSAADESVLSLLIPQIRSKTFPHRAIEERDAFLVLLSQFSNDEVIDVFRSLIKKTYFFSSSRTVRTGLAAVAVLRTNPFPQALNVLKVGLRLAHPRMRKAVGEALLTLENKDGPGLARHG